MIYVETGTNDIFRNLATEYFFAAESDIWERTDEDAVFLFWTTTPTVVVGKYQNVYEEVNLEYVRENKINLIRRMSGGGTMYMDEGGFSFTFITRNDDGGISFAEFLEPVIAALASIGVRAEFTGRNDITIDGKKVSGNSQYKLGGRTVHHGTLLYDTDPERIVRSTTVADIKIISKGIKSVRERVTNIKEHMQTPVTTAEFKELMIDHILSGGKRVSLTEAEINRICEIADEKFRNDDAVYGASPKFSITKTRKTDGGIVEMSFDVKKGHITDCAVRGDFFSTAAPEAWHDALCGCMYERNAIEKAIKAAGLEMYGVTADELARLMTE